MTTMQCPLGHPPGPQQFCPICGRATVPVAEPETTEPPAAGTGAAAGDEARPGPGAAVPPPPPPPAGPPPPPPPPAGPPPQVPPPPAAPSYEPTPPPSHGPAGDEARRLLEELSGGTPATGSSWNVTPPIPPQESGVFPSTDIPSYAPQPPPSDAGPPSPPSAPAPLPAAPGSAYPNILPADAEGEGDVRPRRHDRGRDDDGPADNRPARSKLLPIVLALAVLLGVFLLGKSLLGGDDGAEDDAFTSASPRARASASAAASKPAAPVTYTAAQIELAMKDPHFKHGYDAGKAKAGAGAVSDPESTCRELGLVERTSGYPWGAHDRQGCLVGITS